MPTDEQLSEIRENISGLKTKLDTWNSDISLAEKAGIDVMIQRSKYQELYSKYRRLIAAYGE